MNTLVYAVAWCVVRFIQAFPLRWVAQAGRTGGGVAYFLDARHRRVAIRNLTQCLARSENLGPAQIRALARENFRRLGENYCCAIKTAAMSWEELRPHVEFTGPAWLHAPSDPSAPPPPSLVAAIGHFGNFELYARIGSLNPAYRCATTYRALQPAALNRLFQSLREKSGCEYFERRTEIAALKAWMAPTGRLVGFLADQHAGRSGVRAPFFGIDCATTAAPVVFALRYHLPLCVAVCYRTSLARWRIEVSPPLDLFENGQPRSVEDVTAEFNRAFETAVRRDPANWFWVHNRWKSDKLPELRRRRRPAQEPNPAAAAAAEPGLD